MRLRHKFAFVAATVFVILGTVGIYSNFRSAGQTDLANGVKPVSREFFDDRAFRNTLAELAKLPADQLDAKLRADHPQLESRLVATLRRHGKLGAEEQVASVKFFFVRNAQAQALDGDGKTHTGFLKDQLVASVKPINRDAFTVIVLCLNGGLFEPVELNQATELNLASPVVDNSFEVRPGKGLMPPLDYKQAFKAARTNGFPLYVGYIGGPTISYDKAEKVGPRYRGQPIIALVKKAGRYRPE